MSCEYIALIFAFPKTTEFQLVSFRHITRFVSFWGWFAGSLWGVLAIPGNGNSPRSLLKNMSDRLESGCTTDAVRGRAMLFLRLSNMRLRMAESQRFQLRYASIR